MIAVSFSTTASFWIFLYCITLSVSCLSLHLTSGSSFLLLDCCHIFFNLGTFCFKLRVSTLLSQILLWPNKEHCHKNVHVRLVIQKEEAKSSYRSAFCGFESWDREEKMCCFSGKKMLKLNCYVWQIWIELGIFSVMWHLEL